MSCTACGGSGGKLCSLLKEVGFGFGWDCRANYKLEVHSVLQTKVASTFRIPIETFQNPCRTLVVPWGNYRQYLFQCFAFSTKPQSQHHKRVNNQVAKNTTNDIFIIYIIIYIIPTYSNIRYCNIATMPPRKPHNTGCHRMSQVHTIGTKAAPCFTKTYGNLEESNRLNLEQRISCVPSSKSAHDNMATLSSLPVSIPSCVQYQSVAFAFVFALILQLSAKLCKYVSILVKKLPPKAWLRIAWA